MKKLHQPNFINNITNFYTSFVDFVKFIDILINEVYNFNGF